MQFVVGEGLVDAAAVEGRAEVGAGVAVAGVEDADVYAGLVGPGRFIDIHLLGKDGNISQATLNIGLSV